MDSTGYFGRPNRNNYINNSNVSQNTFETYNDDQYIDNHNNKNRPIANYHSNNTRNLANQRNFSGNNQTFSTQKHKTYNLTKVPKEDAKTKVKNITGRTKPKHILHDPEALREEVFALNRRLDDLKGVNSDLNKKLNVLESENSEYEKIIQENECFWNIGTKTADSTLLINLKKECSKQEEELHEKQEALEACEKNVKNTKLTELKIEVEVQEEECQYLQRIFKDMMNDCDDTQTKGLNELEEKYYKQKNLQNFLEKDNKEMEINLKIQDEQNKAYQEEIKRYEENIQRNEELLEEQKSQMRHKDIQIKNLRREANETKIGSTE